MARRHHPDRNPGDPGAEGRFKAIHEAYAVLSDPTRRRAHEAGRGRTVASETFLADFTDAVERAEWIVFGQLLPRQTGGPRERVARLARDFATSSVPARLLEPRPGLLARLRARREARRLRVHVDYRSHPPAVAGIWRLTGSGWAIVLYPEAFWARGVREPSDLDEAVLTVVLGRVVTILAAEQRVDLHGIDGERGETVIERARDRDRTDTRTVTGQVVFWGAIATLSAVMLYSAWASSQP